MMPRLPLIRCISGLLAGGLVTTAQAQVPAPPDGRILSPAYTGTAYSPYAGRDFPSNVYSANNGVRTTVT